MLGLIWSGVWLGIMNCLDLARRPACFDCGFPRGVPFTLYLEPTFNSFDGRGDILWHGAAADMAFAFVSGAALAFLVRLLSKRDV